MPQTNYPGTVTPKPINTVYPIVLHDQHRISFLPYYNNELLYFGFLNKCVD